MNITTEPGNQSEKEGVQPPAAKFKWGLDNATNPVKDAAKQHCDDKSPHRATTPDDGGHFASSNEATWRSRSNRASVLTRFPG